MANIADSFAQYLQTEGIGTLGTDLFVGEKPADNEATAGYSVDYAGDVETGGNTRNNFYRIVTLNITYQNKRASLVYETIESLKSTINRCNAIPNYEHRDILVTNSFVNTDVLAGEMKYGTVSFQITLFN